MAPESALKLMVTITAPGFGEMEPDNVTEEPTVMGLEDVDNVILVDGLVNVVRVVEVVVLDDV